jgi:hypothetical protein
VRSHVPRSARTITQVGTRSRPRLYLRPCLLARAVRGCARPRPLNRPHAWLSAYTYPDRLSPGSAARSPNCVLARTYGQRRPGSDSPVPLWQLRILVVDACSACRAQATRTHVSASALSLGRRRPTCGVGRRLDYRDAGASLLYTRHAGNNRCSLAQWSRLQIALLDHSILASPVRARSVAFLFLGGSFPRGPGGRRTASGGIRFPDT